MTTVSPATGRRTTTPGDDPTSRTPDWLRRLESPLTTYYVLLSVTVVLVLFGLVMVMSASSVTSIADDQSAYTVFLRQLEYAVLGGIALFVASRIPTAWWRRLAIPALLAAVVLQALVFVPGIGILVNGNRNWIGLGPVTMQPSEVAKLALVLVGALVLSRKARLLGLVLLGHDLGTGIVMGAIVAAVVFAAGVRLRWFALLGVVLATAATVLIVQSPNRLGRFSVWWDLWLGRPVDQYGEALQSVHGRFALADGGWLGLGLGGSREKWSWLPESHNDFIFAIIGEELGLPGTVAVLVLFAALAFACYRLVIRTDDLFVRLATAGVMAWVLTQAMVNIGSVIGLMPVVGVPLPLVSAGGSSLVTTMFVLGMLVSFARHEPQCRDALAARPSVLGRGLAVLPSRGRGRAGS